MAASGNILLIEDEKVIRTALRRLLERHGFTVADAASIPEAERRHEPGSFDLIISDLRLPGPAGTEMIERARGAPVLIMTSYASVKSAVDTMKLGAADYIAKPFDHDEFLHTVHRLLERSRLERQNAALKSDLQRDYPIAGIVGDCPEMQAVFGFIHKVAPTDSTVLILGDSGTGKELVARALHEHSERRQGPLIVVNCAAIPETLIETELFGHERGAFTGAIGAKIGLVEAAHRGTLFLDEIAELTLTAQSRLLRVLQEGEIRRVGAVRLTPVDVRLVAATNRDLQRRVAEGLLREDLYYRLRVMEVRLPSLRERGPDIPALAEFFLDQTRRRLNRSPMHFTADALEAMTRHAWPGNVRELRNAVERAVILSDQTEITTRLLAIHGSPMQLAPASGLDPAGTPPAAKPELSLDDYFRHFVATNQGHMTETELARRLGISRKSLWERRQRLGIPKPSR